MINESDFYKMLPKKYCINTIFVHQCFMSLFNGILNWVGDVLYPRFKYKVITTYDKAIEVFTKKMQNKDGMTQAPFLPALTLDPMLDFSNEERAGRFLWMFKNLDSSSRMWNKIKLTDQGVSITPMFTRYQGTVELTCWMTSIYDLIDFRTTLIQYCGGYQRWIRPELFTTHLILPKPLIESSGPDGKINWDGINPEIITLTTTDTQEYALPFHLDAIWRLDSFSDATNKMGGDQIAEYKCTANLTWECNIPTFIRVENYQYPIEEISMNVGLTPTQAKYPRKMSFPMYSKLNLYREIVPFSKIMPIYNIVNNDAIPLIKLQDDMCYSYPEKYQVWDHYVIGKILDIEKLKCEDDIDNINSILIIDKYNEEYLPYIRKCRGLISFEDKTNSFDLMNLVKNYNISLMCDIKDQKLRNAIRSLHNRTITFDVLGKVIYDGAQVIKCYHWYDDFSKFVFNHNIIKMIKQFKLEQSLRKDGSYDLPFGEININQKITEKKNIICEQFTGVKDQYIYELENIINSNCRDNIVVKINDKVIEKTRKINNLELDNYVITGFKIIFDKDCIHINDGDIISLYMDTDCVQTLIQMICDYKITREDEQKYYVEKKFLEVDISNCRKVDPGTIQCISYNGLMNQDIDFIVDHDKKIITFKIEPHRDCYIQIYGTLV